MRIFDSFAVLLSGLCILHCLALPALFVFVPGVAIGGAHDVDMHVLLFALALPLSAVGLWLGYKIHHLVRYGWLALAGLSAMAVGLAMHGASIEMYWTLAGASLVAMAHVGNWRSSRAMAR